MKLSLIAVMICTIFAALAVACGGDDDSATNTPGASGAVATTAPGGGGNGDTTATEEPSDGGGDDNYQGYFEDLAARFERSRNDSDAATNQVNADLEAGDTLDEDKAAIDLFLERMIEVFDDSILTMNGFDPPAEAEESHFAFRDDIVDAREISITLKDEVADAATNEEARAILDDFETEVIALTDHAQAACRDLQELADEKNIDEDLECKEA
jgi:hypothetical protein